MNEFTKYREVLFPVLNFPNYRASTTVVNIAMGHSLLSLRIPRSIVVFVYDLASMYTVLGKQVGRQTQCQ
jgi:hypothetical protein